jgi:hypothetical protein
MRRLDRAVFAFFLLALLADAARAHASSPVGIDSTDGLILTAVSHLGSDDGVIPPGKPVLHRIDGISPKIDRRERFRLVFSDWSRNLSDFSNFAIQPASAPALASARASLEGLQSSSESISHGLYEHTGSPAP